jgi:aminoglycoside phosphotransferase (APT) family kinase protein
MSSSTNLGSAASEALERWLERSIPRYAGPAQLRKFGFGQSNPTYLLQALSGNYVLRRKPSGPLLPKAHAVEREYRVLRALAGSGVPVPSVFALCEDPDVIGVGFYVMEYVEGRIFYDQTLPGMPLTERAAIFDAMVSAIATLHGVLPQSVGLQSFGRDGEFLNRQISVWTRQYRASESVVIPAMDALIDWLPENVPADQPGRIFHGDLRIDNMVFHPTQPRVVALLDWELSTLGDPIADFAYHAMSWRIPPELFRGLGGLDYAQLGIPAEAAYVEHYCRLTGRAFLPAWNFYLAFSFFRVAAILQGVWRRAQDGQASAADAMQVGAKAGALAAIGWDIAREPLR